MDEEMICPINPHGNGYCKREKCALWIIDITYQDGRMISDESECAFVKLASKLDRVSCSLENIDCQGIGVYHQ